MKVIVSYSWLYTILAITSGCTISFTNISTHGTASDLVDEDLTADPEIDPDVSIPAF